jgi:protocatechuate 3,4-dioxygenase, alpha subunit
MSRTPSQTAGPFVKIGTSWNLGDAVTDGVSVTGCVQDGSGALVTDALLEFWSASGGEFARALTGDDGFFQVWLRGDVQHLDVSIFARGLMQRLVTRIYLSDEEDELDPEVRRRLMARQETPDHYVFDVYLQGDQETVFFLPWPS